MQNAQKSVVRKWKKDSVFPTNSASRFPGLRLVTCCAFSHVKHAMAICSTLPAYSDRIARELHPIPSNQTESGHLLKTYMKEL
mgnify:CR=1 FL=1